MLGGNNFYKTLSRNFTQRKKDKQTMNLFDGDDITKNLNLDLNLSDTNLDLFGNNNKEFEAQPPKDDLTFQMDNRTFLSMSSRKRKKNDMDLNMGIEDLLATNKKNKKYYTLMDDDNNKKQKQDFSLLEQPNLSNELNLNITIPTDSDLDLNILEKNVENQITNEVVNPQKKEQIHQNTTVNLVQQTKSIDSAK